MIASCILLQKGGGDTPGTGARGGLAAPRGDPGGGGQSSVGEAFARMLGVYEFFRFWRESGHSVVM